MALEGKYVLTFFLRSKAFNISVHSNPVGVQRPFSFLRLSPDTVNWENIFLNWDHFGGYYYHDTNISKLLLHTAS
jgi:hypothetical protein